MGAMILLLVSWSGLPEAGAGQWVEGPAEGWADLTLYHHDTQQQYGREGELGDIPNAGHAVATSAFLTGAVGLVRGVDAWIQIPIHHLQYDDFAGERESLGFGDPRVYVRAGPELFGLPAIPVALRAGVKWPGGDFDVDAEVIPLGEGQRDVELLLEVGRSFHPRPLWTMGWIGHRWRAPNVTTARDPGNELFWYWAVGGYLGRLGWKGALEGTRGDPWRIQSILIPTTPRELTQVFFTADWPVGPGRLGGGIRAPFQGRNMPAGSAVSVHYFVRWGERD